MGVRKLTKKSGGGKNPKTTPARQTLRAQKTQRKASKAARSGNAAKAKRLNTKAQRIRTRK